VVWKSPSCPLSILYLLTPCLQCSDPIDLNNAMTQSTLLELPAELRDRILRELLICPNVIYRTTDLKSHNIYPEILYTNKQLRNEGCIIFCGQNTFGVKLYPGFSELSFHVRRWCDQPVQYIRKYHVDIDLAERSDDSIFQRYPRLSEVCARSLKCTPVRYTGIRCTPVICMPMRCTPVR
jgi:hypothetical protein